MDFCLPFFLFVIADTTIPPLIYRLEGKGWMGHFWPSPTLPRAALCRNCRCLYFPLSSLQTPHTPHTSLGILLLDGGNGGEEEGFCWYFILLLSFIYHHLDISSPPTLAYICFIFYTYIPSSTAFWESSSNHCYYCSNQVVVPSSWDSCATQNAAL